MQNCEKWQTLSCLIEEADQYDFHQLLYLLSFLKSGRELSLKPSKAFMFPNGDIKTVTICDEKIVVKCNFDGLYGVDAWNFFEANEKILKLWADLLANRFYEIRHNAWLYKRPYLFYHKHEIYLNYLSALSGSLVHPEQIDLLGLSGLLGNRHRGPAGLKQLLAYCFPECTFSIHTDIPQWRPVFGGGFILGKNTFLGQSYLSASGYLLIDIQMPLVMNVSDLFAQLSKYVRLYLGVFFDISYRFIFFFPKIYFTLGDSAAFLGLHTGFSAESFQVFLREEKPYKP